MHTQALAETWLESRQADRSTSPRHPPGAAIAALALALWFAATPTQAHAQPPSNRGGAARAGRAEGSPPLDVLIAAALGGGSDESVDAALDALRERGDERATDALVSLARHRRVGARRRAYLALAVLRGEGARAAVSAGLSDVDPGIRSLCARALGEMGARESLPRLFMALERGVHDAARSIGALASAHELPRFDAQLGRVPLAAMLEGYGRYVRRQDVSWEAKQDVLHRLFEVAGLEVRAFLVQWQRDLPPSAPAALRADLDRSIRRIPLRPRPRSGPPSPAASRVPAAGTEVVP